MMSRSGPSAGKDTFPSPRFHLLIRHILCRLQRGPDGKFDDAKLAEIIYNAINTPAHAFGARGVPESMRVVEIMTIEQNRAWGTCTLNEFRKFFGLKPLRDFKEWNPDPAVNVSFLCSSLRYRVSDMSVISGSSSGTVWAY
jgi:hypothetical protein